MSGLIKEYKEPFANMVVADYVTANTDRNVDNWGFLVNNETNDIKGFAPLYDLNQSLVADEFGTDINDLVYEPTKDTFLNSIRKWAQHSTLDFDKQDLPEKCKERWKTVQLFASKNQMGFESKSPKISFQEYGSMDIPFDIT